MQISWAGVVVVVSVVAAVVLSLWLASEPEVPLALVAILAAVMPGLLRRHPPAAPLLLLAVVAGCGGPPQATRTAVSVAGQAYAAGDEVLAERYTEAATECLEAATRAEYDACTRPWDRAVEAGASVRYALVALESALDAWEAGAGNRPWVDAASCAARAAQRWSEALWAVGVSAPLLEEARRLLEPWAEAECVLGGDE